MGENSWNGFETNCLFANRGDGSFVDVGRAIGADALPDGRAVAIADLDLDGRLDLAINNNAAAPTILLNRVPDAGRSVALDLVGSRSNRDAVGARVRLTAGGRTMTRLVEAGSGYASQSSHTLHFGLGEATRVEAVEVEWPSGHRQALDREQLERLSAEGRARISEPTSRIAAEAIPSTATEG